jgi:hypothetical protein
MTRAVAVSADKNEEGLLSLFESREPPDYAAPPAQAMPGASGAA